MKVKKVMTLSIPSVRSSSLIAVKINFEVRGVEATRRSEPHMVIEILKPSRMGMLLGAESSLFIVLDES